MSVCAVRNLQLLEEGGGACTNSWDSLTPPFSVDFQLLNHFQPKAEIKR